MSSRRFIAVYWLVTTPLLFGLWCFEWPVWPAAAEVVGFYFAVVPLCWLLDWLFNRR